MDDGCNQLVRRGDALMRCGFVGDCPQHGSRTVYSRFCEEVDAMAISADEHAVNVVGRLTRAVKRAQMVVNGELPPVAERAAEDKANY